jgi:HAE1 family hydrophobic/amphiphilic exporter-1
MLIAVGLAIAFVYLILSSLYESFVTPFTIMLALPLAVAGGLIALFLFDQSMNLFSMIGMIMLLGLVTKNSILLVDYTLQLIHSGMSRNDALMKAGLTRLRPILMTTVALIAGMLPIALGLSEAARSRTSMGIAIIGGLISSTLLTLVVVPAAFGFIDDFRQFSARILGRLFLAKANGKVEEGAGE